MWHANPIVMHIFSINLRVDRRGVGEARSSSSDFGIRCPKSTSRLLNVPSVLILNTQAEGITIALGGNSLRLTTSTAPLPTIDLNSLSREASHLRCTDGGNFFKCARLLGVVASQMLTFFSTAASSLTKASTWHRLRSYKGFHHTETAP